MTMAAKEEASLRVLMFPWLAHAHLSPFLELAKNLSNKNFQIYLCSTPINLDSIKNNLQKDTLSHHHYFPIQLIPLHLPSLPPHYHTTKHIPPHLLHLLMKAFRSSSPAFAEIITKLKPDLLIYDGLQPWAAKIAAAQGIPAVFFCVSGSTSMAYFHHMHKHGSPEGFPSRAIRIKGFELRSMLKQGESMQLEKEEEEEEEDEGLFLSGVFELSCQIVLIKSCRGIEGKYMDHLSSLLRKRILPTGPLITFGQNQENADSDIMEWLSERKEHSTLYISFGSENYFSRDQILAIAKGLEEVSDVNFIWVARSPAGSEIVVEEALPPGFLQSVKGRGMIVKGWAPQASILAHPNVGGYMSHCGWTSITESIYFAVPVVAVPLQSDHPLNARLVVEVGVGVEVERDEDGGFDGDGVARAIKEVFAEGTRMRTRVKEMSEKMKMEEEEAIDGVAAELLRICLKKQA